MKKIVALMLLGLIGFAFIRYLSTEHESDAFIESDSLAERELEEKVKKEDEKKPFLSNLFVDKKKVSKDSSQKILKDAENFSLSKEDFVKKWKSDSAIALEMINKKLDEKLECLEENLCGENPLDGSPYFNPKETKAHSEIERQLELLVAFKEEGVKIPDEMKSILTLALKQNNEMIQQLAYELLYAQSSNVHFEEGLGKIKELQPGPAASAFVILAKESSETSQRRKKYISALNKTYENEDQSYAVEIAQRSKAYRLNISELEGLARKTCSLMVQNQKMVRMYLQETADGLGETLEMNCVD